MDIKEINKDGFELEPNTRLSYSPPTGGDFANPMIFKMWHTNSHQNLITGEKNFRINPDGRTRFINFASASMAETSGDLAVSVTETATNQIYYWSCQIAVVDGGLQEETDSHSSTLSAPTVGYSPNFRLQQQFKGDPRGESGNRRFYITLKNGAEFGRVAIEIYAPYNNQIPGLVHISYAINPSGSRTLY